MEASDDGHPGLLAPGSNRTQKEAKTRAGVSSCLSSSSFQSEQAKQQTKNINQTNTNEEELFKCSMEGIAVAGSYESNQTNTNQEELFKYSMEGIAVAGGYESNQTNTNQEELFKCSMEGIAVAGSHESNQTNTNQEELFKCPMEGIAMAGDHESNQININQEELFECSMEGIAVTGDHESNQTNINQEELLECSMEGIAVTGGYESNQTNINQEELFKCSLEGIAVAGSHESNQTNTNQEELFKCSMEGIAVTGSHESNQTNTNQKELFKCSMEGIAVAGGHESNQTSTNQEELFKCSMEGIAVAGDHESNQTNTNQEELFKCSMEGIAMAGGHESGHGLFGADMSMSEAQEAAKEYHSSPFSLSTSPTPSPPLVAPGQGGEATATPLAWSLGAEKPSEAAGDNGTQTAGQGEQANLSSGQRRGRPRGSGRRQILASLGEWYALSAGWSFTPHVIIVGSGEDVAARIMSFSQKGPRSACILSANGSVSNVTLRQPDSPGNTTYKGCFEILQLKASFTMTAEGRGRKRTGGLSVSLAGPDGRVLGGVVVGMLRAATPVQMIVGSFLPNNPKRNKRRMTSQQAPSSSSAPALPAPTAPPPVVTEATPISQVAPGNGFRAPPPPSAVPQQAHAGADHGTTSMNLDTAGFTMAGWPSSSQSVAHRSSSGINVNPTPRE